METGTSNLRFSANFMILSNASILLIQNGLNELFIIIISHFVTENVKVVFFHLVLNAFLGRFLTHLRGDKHLWPKSCEYSENEFSKTTLFKLLN